MNVSEIKKLDEETLRKLTEGKGPSDECLCGVLAPEEDPAKRGFRQSIRKAFASIGQARLGRQKQKSVDVPLTFTKGGKGIYTTKETVKTNCGKCGCSKSNIVLKHSYANIKISTPDISSICPCPSNCLPEKARKLSNNIKVTVERLSVENPSFITEPDSGYTDTNSDRTETNSDQGSLNTLTFSENSGATEYSEEN